jgi:hypothetical protein
MSHLEVMGSRLIDFELAPLVEDDFNRCERANKPRVYVASRDQYEVLQKELLFRTFLTSHSTQSRHYRYPLLVSYSEDWPFPDILQHFMLLRPSAIENRLLNQLENNQLVLTLHYCLS